MVFQPDGFMGVAKRLAAENPSEAELRTSVGRAYYCIFLLCRERVRPRLPAAKLKVNTHANVIALVRSTQAKVGNKLDRLRWLRVWADYCLSAQDYALFKEPPPHLEWDVHWEEALSLADDILAKVHRL